MITRDEFNWANTNHARLVSIAGEWAKRYSIKRLMVFSDYYDTLMLNVANDKCLSYSEKEILTKALENRRFVARFAVTIKEEKRRK